MSEELWIRESRNVIRLQSWRDCVRFFFFNERRTKEEGERGVLDGMMCVRGGWGGGGWRILNS